MHSKHFQNCYPVLGQRSIYANVKADVLVSNRHSLQLVTSLLFSDIDESVYKKTAGLMLIWKIKSRGRYVWAVLCQIFGKLHIKMSKILHEILGNNHTKRQSFVNKIYRYLGCPSDKFE